MSDRTIIVAALIIGGAIIATMLQTRVRYALSAADNNVAWRMDTWSGQIDICAAAYLPNGPVVRCGAFVVGTGENAVPPRATEPDPTDPRIPSENPTL